MNRRPAPVGPDVRLRTLEGKLVLIAELRTAPPERAVSLLLELLCDQSWHVRERAVEALATHGQEVVEPIKTLLAEGLWYTRACAADALGRIGAVEGLELLAGQLGDDNVTVRRAVSGALAKMAARHGSRMVREALAKAGVAVDPSGRPGRLGVDARELELALAAADEEAKRRESRGEKRPASDPS